MIGKLFIIFVLFQNIITRFMPSVISYWDEALSLTFGILLLTKSKGKFYKKDFTYLITLLAIIAIGLIGNIAFSYQKSVSAIIRDIVGFIKFPIVFLALYRMNLGKYLSHKMEALIPAIKIIVWVIFAFGLLSVFVDIGMSQEEVRGLIHPYMFLYTHPTYLTTGLICILCILNTTGAATIKEDIVILGSVALAMRTKGLAFIAVYIFLKYGSRWLRKFKIFYWFAIIGIVLIVASSKLQMYASFSNSPRESLYVGAITLFKDYFPIGSGFASFASHISGKYFSGVYNVIHIAGLYGADGQISPDVGDAGIPYYLGQFGFIGMIFIGILIYMMIKISLHNLDAKRKMGVVYLWLMIAISIPTEALLVNNGVEIAFTMAMASLLARKNNNIGNSCKGYIKYI